MKLYLVIDTFEDRISKSFLKELHVWEFLATKPRSDLRDERYKVVSLDVADFGKDL